MCSGLTSTVLPSVSRRGHMVGLLGWDTSRWGMFALGFTGVTRRRSPRTAAFVPCRGSYRTLGALTPAHCRNTGTTFN